MQTVMSPLEIRNTVDALYKTWMARYTRTAHEVSGLYQWVVFYRPDGGTETRMLTGVNAVVHGDSLAVAPACGMPRSIPMSTVLEVHLKPCS